MYPQICRVFEPRLDRQRLVVCFLFAGQEVGGDHRRPQDGAAQLGCNGEAEVDEPGTATRLRGGKGVGVCVSLLG
eukprot:scaffold24268_cov99-Isochrysis_galbana.AAC.5